MGEGRTVQVETLSETHTEQKGIPPKQAFTIERTEGVQQR